MVILSVGVNDKNVRVKHAALHCLGCLLDVLAPKIQVNFHSQLTGRLIELMSEDTIMKLKTQATQTMLNFCRGMVADEEDDNSFDGSETLKQYIAPILQALGTNLDLGIQQKCEQLQNESLSLISTIADVVGSSFDQYFNVFTTSLKMGIGIPQTTENTVTEKQLLAKMIMALGSIIRAVTNCEDTEPFKPTVLEITTYISNLLASNLPEDDPRDEAIKEALTECAGFLGVEFAQFMPLLMETLIRDAKLDVDFKMESADTPNTTGPNTLAMNMKVKGMGE